MDNRDKQLWMLVMGMMFLCLIALTFTARKPWYLHTLGSTGVQSFQFPTQQDCEKAKSHVDSEGLFVLTQCEVGK